MIPLVWRMTVLALLLLLLLFGMSGWVSSSTTTADNNDNQVKRTFVNILDNATIDVIKECVDTDNAYSVIDVSSPANNKVPLHHHTKYEEIAQVLEGTLFFQVDKGEPIMLSVGESISVGPNKVHTWWTGEDEPAKFRAITRPCFDGFHEGLELVANVAKSKSDEDWGVLQKFRYHAVMWQMMATEIDERFGSIFGFLFRHCARTNKSQAFLLNLRDRFLPHLRGDALYSSETPDQTVPNAEMEL